MTRVLLVGKGPPDRGGISAFLQTLLASVLRHAFDLRLVNLTREDVPGPRKLTARNLTRVLEDARAVFAAARRGDIVHIHSALASHLVVLRAGALALAARLRGARAIVHAHSGRSEAWFSTPARRLAGRVALRPAQRVVTVAAGGQAALTRALGRDRVTLVANGVDAAEFGPAEPAHDPPRVLFAGVLTPRKGVLDLLAASRGLCAEGIDHELWLAGGTPDEGQEAEAAVRDDAGTPARWLGALPREHMPDVYRQADVFCLPSWGEAAPLSVLEAMATGLPVVASRVGDIPMMVDAGVTGLLVAPRDVAGLTAALQTLLTDPQRRARMGTAGRDRAAARFSSAAMTGALADLYRGLATDP